MAALSKYTSNIYKYYLSTSLAHFAFYSPIIQIFFLANQLTIFQIAMLGVVWTIVNMALEIPSSILADRWGRKRTLILASIFSIFSVVPLIYADSNYWIFIIATIFSGGASAFLSGTNVAFFYDNLKALNKEKEFDKLWARRNIYQQIPLLFAFTSSGFLYDLSPLLPFKLSIIALILSAAVIFTLNEPKYHKPIKEISAFTHLKQSGQVIFKSSYLKAMLLFVLIFSLGSDISFGYGQIYLNLLAMPIVLFGIAYTLKSLLVTFAANIAPYLRRKFSYEILFAIQIVSITALMYLLVFTKNYLIGALGFILIAIPHGLFETSKSSYMHAHLKSHQRATVDSMFSFLLGTIFLIIGPAIGYLADLYSIKIPFFIVAAVMSIYCIYYLIAGIKKFA